LARRLLADHATVISLDQRDPRVAVAQHERVNLADPDDIDAALGRIEGRFDVLANVAGIPGTEPGELVFKVNFLGTRHLTEALLDRLNPGGSVVNISSVAGYRWPERLMLILDLLSTASFGEGLDWFHIHRLAGNAYTFSKQALTVYTMARAGAFRARGLRVNAVLPGPVETAILVDFEKSIGRHTVGGAGPKSSSAATPAPMTSPPRRPSSPPPIHAGSTAPPSPPTAASSPRSPSAKFPPRPSNRAIGARRIRQRASARTCSPGSAACGDPAVRRWRRLGLVLLSVRFRASPRPNTPWPPPPRMPAPGRVRCRGGSRANPHAASATRRSRPTGELPWLDGAQGVLGSAASACAAFRVRPRIADASADSYRCIRISGSIVHLVVTTERPAQTSAPGQTPREAARAP